MLLTAIKLIGEDIIPAPPKERLFLALAEMKTVLAVGESPVGPGKLAPSVGIYRLRDDGGYQGWLYLKEEDGAKKNALIYNENISACDVMKYPGIVKTVYSVHCDLTEKTADKKTLEEIIALVLATSSGKKKKMN